MFIVLEGLDGAGKSTQITKLKEMFNQRGVATEYLHFPRFDAPVYGDLIARFLRGDLGTVEGVTPYLVALLYAGDRANAAKTINGWLAEGKVVIVDRYVYSNIGYQCAKLPAGKERDMLRKWILSTEFEEFAIPRPDVSLFLDVPFSFTERKLTETREGEDRSYLQGAKDIHEASLDLQRRVREVYLEAAACSDDIKVVDCSTAEGTMASPEAIYERIMHHITPFLNTAVGLLTEQTEPGNTEQPIDAVFYKPCLVPAVFLHQIQHLFDSFQTFGRIPSIFTQLLNALLGVGQQVFLADNGHLVIDRRLDLILFRPQLLGNGAGVHHHVSQLTIQFLDLLVEGMCIFCIMLHVLGLNNSGLRSGDLLLLRLDFCVQPIDFLILHMHPVFCLRLGFLVGIGRLNNIVQPLLLGRLKRILCLLQLICRQGLSTGDAGTTGEALAVDTDPP